METNENKKFQFCPICGQHIFVSESKLDFYCADEECVLWDGAKDCIDKINTVLNNLN